MHRKQEVKFFHWLEMLALVFENYFFKSQKNSFNCFINLIFFWLKKKWVRFMNVWSDSTCMSKYTNNRKILFMKPFRVVSSIKAQLVELYFVRDISWENVTYVTDLVPWEHRELLWWTVVCLLDTRWKIPCDCLKRW